MIVDCKVVWRLTVLRTRPVVPTVGSAVSCPTTRTQASWRSIITSPGGDCGTPGRERRILFSPPAAPSCTPGVTRTELTDTS